MRTGAAFNQEQEWSVHLYHNPPVFASTDLQTGHFYDPAAATLNHI
jgi:hypothetical protein